MPVTQRNADFPPAQIIVTTRGEVPRSAVAHGQQVLARVFRCTNQVVLAVHLVLALERHPARRFPALAEVGVSFDHSQVRAKGAARDLAEAVDGVADRLQHALLRHEDRRRTRHRWLGVGREHEWRHGDLPSPTLEHFRRPPAEREVVRRKTFALEPMTIDEAAFDMDLLGHRFYLFVDLGSGNDALVRRTDADGYAVQGNVVVPSQTAVPVAHDGPAPVLGDEQARAHLDLAGEPFVFYLDLGSGRGRVLYQRYDGHYGLIEAA